MTCLLDYSTKNVSGAYNELLEDGGELRPHWRSFFNTLETEGVEKIPFYAEQANRLFRSDRQNDDTFAHGFIPFILSQNDFNALERGLTQRAQVLNDTLRDLYGEQLLLKKGVLPAKLIFGHSSYLPALKNIFTDESVLLTEYTVDVERAPDGRFWVCNDSTQLPHDIGVSIKNRLVLSRIIPRLYEKTAPKRIFHTLQALSRHLVNLSPEHNASQTPCVVLLTRSTADFDNSFLARNLGISIVEPGDLSVRDNYLYLKNMNGLKRVDVVFRCIEDDLCDPLELNGFSNDGIAGLTQAVRCGHVKIANPLGSGTAQIPALNAFIHGICRFFTGEELMLPSVATWWCGQKKEARYVCAHKDDLNILNALDGTPATTTRTKILATPDKYIATESVNASLAPVFHRGKIVTAPVRLRFHLIWDNGSYKLMPGGCAFTKIRKETFIHDIWVPDSEKGKEKSAFLPVAVERPLKPVRSTFDLTSHTAENMFWLGRYLERSEDIVRLMRATLKRVVDSPELPEPNDLATLLNVLSWLGYIEAADFQKNDDRQTAIDTILQLISTKENVFGLHMLFSNIKKTADLLRDRLSADTWEIFTNLSGFLPEKDCSPRVALNRLETLILQQNALSGLIRENMTREISWRFMEIGRRLERAIHVLDIMSATDVCAKNGFNAALETLLETSDSRMTYRARYLSMPVVPLVFDLLVCDETNPRSVVYQVLKLRQNISKIALESNETDLFQNELDIIGTVLDTIAAIDVSTLARETGVDFDKAVDLNPAVISTLTDLRKKLTAFSDSLTLHRFVHATPTRQGPVYHKG